MTEREFQKQLRNYHKTQIMTVELAMELLSGCRLECMYEDETWDAFEMAIRAMSVIEDIKSEIAGYKDNKIIHAERNEMIDIVLAIIDRHINGKENV